VVIRFEHCFRQPDNSMTSPAELFPPTKKPAESLSGVTVRLAGDSGDGMALASAVFRFSFPPRKFLRPAMASTH